MIYCSKCNCRVKDRYVHNLSGYDLGYTYAGDCGCINKNIRCLIDAKNRRVLFATGNKFLAQMSINSFMEWREIDILDSIANMINHEDMLEELDLSVVRDRILSGMYV